MLHSIAFPEKGRCLSLVLLLAGLLSGQSGPATIPLGSTRIPVVVLLGASVTAGYAGLPFGRTEKRSGTVPLRRVVAGFWDEGQVQVRDRSDMATFIDPLAKQSRRVRRVVSEHPDLVVAIDFLFWFGYGRVRGVERSARLALQQQGFALLEQIDCPILVGDYPDMRGADARVLPSRAVPSLDVLRELNERTVAFVAEHENMHLFPLARWVKTAVEEGELIADGGRRLKVAPLGLLQQDRLHANRLGMAILGVRVAELLSKTLPQHSPVRPRGVTLERMVQRCHAEVDFDELEVVSDAHPRVKK